MIKSNSLTPALTSKDDVSFPHFLILKQDNIHTPEEKEENNVDIVKVSSVSKLPILADQRLHTQKESLQNPHFARK